LTVSSTSTGLAATANSVKTTYDLANTANTTANAATPKIGLDSYLTYSSTTLATIPIIHSILLKI
jgi:hypothetical protein